MNKPRRFTGYVKHGRLVQGPLMNAEAVQLLEILPGTSCISISGKNLYGQDGGQLEFVSQRVEWRQYPDGKHLQVIVMRFTDHDHDSYTGKEDFPPFEGMIDNKYYELEFPIASAP